jgi:hypothetical protein
MGNCNSDSSDGPSDSKASKENQPKIAILTFSGPDAFNTSKVDEVQATFSDPVFFTPGVQTSFSSFKNN